mgnify:CR=1 FL=1
MIGQEVYNIIYNEINPLDRLDIELSNPIVIDKLEYVYTLKLYQKPNSYPSSVDEENQLYSREWYFLLDKSGQVIRGGEVFVVNGKSKIDYSLGIEIIRGIQLNKLGI